MYLCFFFLKPRRRLNFSSERVKKKKEKDSSLKRGRRRRRSLVNDKDRSKKIDEHATCIPYDLRSTNRVVLLLAVAVILYTGEYMTRCEFFRPP